MDRLNRFQTASVAGDAPVSKKVSLKTSLSPPAVHSKAQLGLAGIKAGNIKV